MSRWIEPEEQGPLWQAALCWVLVIAGIFAAGFALQLLVWIASSLS